MDFFATDANNSKLLLSSGGFYLGEAVYLHVGLVFLKRSLPF